MVAARTPGRLTGARGAGGRLSYVHLALLRPEFIAVLPTVAAAQDFSLTRPPGFRRRSAHAFNRVGVCRLFLAPRARPVAILIFRWPRAIRVQIDGRSDQVKGLAGHRVPAYDVAARRAEGERGDQQEPRAAKSRRATGAERVEGQAARAISLHSLAALRAELHRTH